MLETAISRGGNAGAENAAESRKALHWRVNDRMGGKVPVWKASDDAKSDVAGRLSEAAAPDPQNFDSALAYADSKKQAMPGGEQAFGLGDLVDMVNPLQHLPVVGHVYREVTGDEIRPISKIIGGGLYGGPAGAAAGLVNTVVEYETGKDVAGNVMAMAFNGEKPAYRSERMANTPARQLNETISKMEKGDAGLPGNMIGFTDLGYGKRAVYERVPAADGRTAGSMVQRREEISAPNPVREPITQISFDPMPLRLREEMQN